MMLIGCGGGTGLEMRTLDRPPPLSEFSKKCSFEAVPEGVHCVDTQCYISITQYIQGLNYTIDRYELMVDEFNR